MDNSIQTDDLAVFSTEFRSPVALAGWRQLEPEGFAPKWQAPESSTAGCGCGRWLQAGSTTTRPAICTARSPAISSRPPGSRRGPRKSRCRNRNSRSPGYSSGRRGRSRIVRLGELFTLLHKPDGVDAWAVVDQMIRPDLPQILNVGLTAHADWGSVALTYPDYRAYNERGVGKGRADLVADVDWIRFRRPVVGRFPIANIDAPATFGRGIIERRRRDLLAD